MILYPENWYKFCFTWRNFKEMSTSWILCLLKWISRKEPLPMERNLQMFVLTKVSVHLIQLGPFKARDGLWAVQHVPKGDDGWGDILWNLWLAFRECSQLIIHVHHGPSKSYRIFPQFRGCKKKYELESFILNFPCIHVEPYRTQEKANGKLRSRSNQYTYKHLKAFWIKKSSVSVRLRNFVPL